MEENKIKLARYRHTDYTVNYENKHYQWSGCKGKNIDIKPIPEEVVDYLQMNTLCFSKGELVIVKEDELSEAKIENIEDKEIYEANTHTREEIVSILEGNINKMKSELNKITNKNEKEFVLAVAKEIKLDSSTKRQFIADWLETKMDTDLLFTQE